MQKHNNTIFLNLVWAILLSTFISCGGSGLSLKIENKNNLTENDNILIKLNNPKNKVIDSVVYQFQNKSIKSKNNLKLDLSNIKLGKHKILAKVYYNSAIDSISEKVTIYSSVAPKIFNYNIVNTYPHNISSYTQGLEFYSDTLYESIGQYGKSKLLKTDYKTGKYYQEIKLNKAYFGEGITIFNNKIYQLTWREKIGFMYNMNFEKIGLFKYNKSKEGWGLCNDGSQIYKSDGSGFIWILDPETLIEKDNIQICSDKSIFSKANELEWVDNKIYANTYLKDGIMIINPKSGAVLGVIDCRGLKNKVMQHKELDVLNGIAYNPKTKTFFITGKNWDKLFEIKIEEKNKL